MKILIENYTSLPDYLAMYFSSGIDALETNERIWDRDGKDYLVKRRINKKSKIFTVEPYHIINQRRNK